ncbi:MAG: aspartate aminotransferase family protein [Candidatus Hydrogenedentota bacterium]
MNEKYLTEEQILQMREEYLLPCVMKYFSKPLHIVRGEMQYVYDVDGKRYLDAFSAVVTISVGYCHPDVIKKTIEQNQKLQHITTLYLTESVVKYAKKLHKKAPPSLKRCFFTNSGTEANEMAAMLAKNYTKSQEFIALQHSFHGRTLMSMSFTGQSIWRHSLPYVFGVTQAPAAYCYRCPFKTTYPRCGCACAEYIEDIIKYNTSGRIAGFIHEPIHGFGGVIEPPKEYFKIAYDIIKKYGGINISDEVQTGFGRTGRKFFGIENWGVVPDIITMAKGMGNGIPIGGVIASDEVAEAIRGKIHFSTYGGNPVSMVQGLEVINVIERYKYQENIERLGKFLKSQFKRLMDKHPIIGDVRGFGFMLGIELVKNRKTKEPAAEELLFVMELCKDRGLFIGKGAMAGNVIRIKPPFCITKQDAEFIVNTLDETLKIAEKKYNIK